MKKLKTVQDLDTFLKSINSEIVNHVCDDDNDNSLPSYSLEQLYSEGRPLYNYVYQDNNYVPDYYGCGLLSRCLAIAQDNGAIFDKKFFTSLGHSNRVAEEMVNFSWY